MGKINERLSKCNLKLPLVAMLVVAITAGCSSSGVKAAESQNAFEQFVDFQSGQLEAKRTEIEKREAVEKAKALRLSQDRAKRVAVAEAKAAQDKVEAAKESQRKAVEAAAKKKAAAVELKAKTQQKAPKGAKWDTFKLTHYIATCKGCSGKTATGIDVRHILEYQGYKILSVDPNRIPLGSIVEIKEKSGKTYRAIAIDTGGAIKGNKLDLLVGSYREAISLGKKSVQLRIVRSGW